MAAKQFVEVEGRRLALTNLDKVLYAGSRFTKAQVIDYYTAPLRRAPRDDEPFPRRGRHQGLL